MRYVTQLSAKTYLVLLSKHPLASILFFYVKMTLRVKNDDFTPKFPTQIHGQIGRFTPVGEKQPKTPINRLKWP
jgi:hypothetical protein